MEENLQKCFTELDSIIPIIDKIGSGFEDSERTALALLLYFREEEVLDKLAKIRKIIGENLQRTMGEEKFDEFIEQETKHWSPPYGASQEKLLNMLNRI